MAEARVPAVFNVASLSSNPSPTPESSKGADTKSSVPAADSGAEIKPLAVQPDIDQDTEIDFGNAKSPDDVKTRERPEPIDPTKPKPKEGAVDPKSAPAGKPKQDVKFDVETLKAKEEKEESDAEDDTGSVEEETQDEEKSIQQQPSGKSKREYTGIPEIDEILSELPNAKYNKARQLLPELFGYKEKVTTLEKQLSERAPEQVSYWYDHPEGYTLDEGFRAAQRDYSQAEFERNHFERQLANIESGEAWQNLVGYQKDGTPIYETVEPLNDGKIDSRSRARLLGMVAKYGSMQQGLQEKLTQHRSSFSENAKRGQAELQEVESRIFPRWKDKKALSKEDTAALDLVRDLYPKHMRTHPAVQHAGMAFREFQRLAETYKGVLTKMQGMEAELNRLRGRVSKPLPSSSGNDNGAGDDDDDVIDLKKLNREFSKV